MAKAISTADSAIRPNPIPLTFWPFWPTCPGRLSDAVRSVARLTG